jgi:integrase
VRTYASVRHFARWIHNHVQAFPLGCPTDGIKPPKDPEPEWKGLSRADELRLLNAAQTLRVRPGRATEHIKVSPHVLRHTFLRKLAEEKGIQYAKEASGHRGDRYIWRYVKPDRQSLADAIDAME